jgi:O-antigen/teichoic acid export membrane protein
LPLSILFIIKDKSLYTLVEVAFSYATLCMVIIELGVSNYLFYGYKKAVDKERFVADTQLYFKFLLLIYCLLSLVLFFGIHFYDKTLVMLFVLISIRTLFTLFINFYSNIYRLKDNPSMIYLTSILVNTCSVVLVMLAHFFTWGHTLLYFFIPSLVLITWVSIKFALVELRKFDFSGFRTFLMHSLKFSWPIILNVLAMSYVNNYAKIYAYGHLSQQETVQISYIMRIGLVVQLTHSAFSSFFSKTLFMDTEHKFNFKIFKQYNLVLLFSACLVMVAVFLTNYFFGDQIQIALTTSTFLLLLYIILWCYIGYLEIYFGVMNANRKILYYSIVSSLIYTILLMIFKNIDLLKLSLCMVISAVINLSFVVVGLNKMRVFSLKSQA